MRQPKRNTNFIKSFPLFHRAPRSPLIPHSPSAICHHFHPLATVQSATSTSSTNSSAPTSGGGQQVQVAGEQSNDKYQIMVDVSHFTPDEITVKTVDNTIVVTGKHEDKADNYGYVSRQFSRKYLLPADVDPETVTSTLSADGVLSIQAPRKPLQIKDTDGRSVPIAISNQMISPVINPMDAPQFPQPAQPQVPQAAPTSIPVTSEAQPQPVAHPPPQ